MYTLLFIDTEHEAELASKVDLPENSGLFSFNGWKLAMDGGPAAQTTLMYNKNLSASKISYPYHSQDEMNRIVKMLHNTGLQIAVHVAGDEGIDMTLTAFEQAMQENPRPDPRHRIEHCIFPSASALQRIEDDKIIVSTQPQWITWYGDGYTQLTDETTMNHLLPLKTMLDKGIHLSFGCDVPASPYQEPKWAFMGSVLRRTGAGTLLTQDEKLSIQEALRIHTMGSAYAGFAENTTGSLEVGKFADMVIWSNDLYNIGPGELNNFEAEMTIVGGEILYDNGKNQVTSVNAKNSIVPLNFQLLQNYPNPFNPSTKIDFKVSQRTNIKISVYNLLGEKVRDLLNREMNEGTFSINWNGKDNFNRDLANGVYFIKMETNKYVKTIKAVLLK